MACSAGLGQSRTESSPLVQVIDQTRGLFPDSAAHHPEPYGTSYRPGTRFERLVLPLPILEIHQPSATGGDVRARTRVHFPLRGFGALVWALLLCSILGWLLMMVAFVGLAFWTAHNPDAVAGLSLTQTLSRGMGLAAEIGFGAAWLLYAALAAIRIPRHWRRLQRAAAAVNSSAN